MMRATTIHGLAAEHSVATGCTHAEAIVEVCQRHRLAEIPEMPVVVFHDGEVMPLSDSHDRAQLRRHSELLDLGHQFAREYASRVRMREGL
jgi:hypothetical protein